MLLANIRWWLWNIRSQLRHFWQTGHFYRHARIRPELLCREHYEQRYGRKTSNDRGEPR